VGYFVVIWYILWSFGIFCGHLVYFVVTWYILWSLGIFCGHLVYFVVIWYIFPDLVYILYHEKSGNPGSTAEIFKYVGRYLWIPFL
jgi:hypothetical protein